MTKSRFAVLGTAGAVASAASPKEEPARRTLRPKPQINVAADRSDSEQDQEPGNQRALIKVLTPPVLAIHSRRAEAGKQEYLVRFAGRSPADCVWASEADLIERDPSLKNKIKRFDKKFDTTAFDSDNELRTIGMEVENSNVDRVLDCSEVFTLIHPKKAGEIKGKWSEGLVRVLRSLVNFQTDRVYYGVFYIELGALLKQYAEFQDPLDFSVLTNKVYLDCYTTPEKFWDDLEGVYKSVDKLCQYLDEKSDVFELNERMRQLTAKLYGEWLAGVKVEAAVFRAQVDQPEFAEAVQSLKSELVAMFESSTATAEKVVRLFDTNLKWLKHPTFVHDRRFETAKALVGQLKTGLGIPERNNGDNTGQQNVIVPELHDLTKEEEEEHKNGANGQQNGAGHEVEVGMEIEPANEANGQGSPTPPMTTAEPDTKGQAGPTEAAEQRVGDPATAQSTLSIDEQVALMTQISQLVQEMCTDLEAIVTKNYWNNFLINVNHLPPLPRSFPPVTAITWASSATLATLGKNLELLFYIKWEGCSYTEATWERESELEAFSVKIGVYKRNCRAMVRELRTAYLSRLDTFTQLRDITENQRVLDRTPQSQLNELRHQIFLYKDPKNVVVYTAKNQPIYKEGRTLRSYQLESLNWMIDAWAKRRNVILADEMGLGKTIQAMSFVNYLIQIERQMGPYLIIAPLSTLSHWKKVFEDWSHLNVILYYDSNGKAGRQACQMYEFNHWDITVKGIIMRDKNIAKFSVMITSYEVFIQDFDAVFRTFPFQHVIVDEAQKLKNKNAKIFSILRRLVCQRVLLLTGTPIQNNLSELWSLLNFIDPSTFNDLNKFLLDYKDGKELGGLQKLHTTLQPYLLRRMKEDVESSIPPLTETIIDIELTSVQKIVYKTLYEKNKGTLQKGLGFSGINIMNNLEMQLRKCCNHPFTLHDIVDDLTKECLTHGEYIEKLISISGKMIFMDKALRKFQEEGKKALIFSQFTDILRLLGEYLDYKGIRYYKIDGSTKARDRQTAIDRFTTNKEFEVFLLSTKAGGIGINLTSASVVFIYDSDWNPQNDIQAIARAHRIGQTNEVKVFRLISKKTYESEMFEKASIKLGLDQAIVMTNAQALRGGDSTTDDINRRRPEEIERLLRKGAIGLIEDNLEDSGDQAQFTQNIDDIIQNARTAKYSMINKCYTLGKQKFVADAKDELLQISDPDFWKKAFANIKTTIDNFEKEFQTLVHSDKIKKVEAQKGFFLRLSEEVYRYLSERVTGEQFSPDTESRLCNILIDIMDNNQFHKVIRELAGQLNIDLSKGGRRIKKIDEKTLNGLLKIQMPEGEAKRGAAEAIRLDLVQPKKRQGVSGQAKGDEVVMETNSHEDSQVFENNDDNVIISLREERRARHEEKLRNCDFCGLKEDLLVCSGPCKKMFHERCLREDQARWQGVKSGSSPTNGAAQLTAQSLADQKLSVITNGVCVYCTQGRAACFCCRQSGPIAMDGYLHTDIGVKNLGSTSVYKCSICPKFYHPKCISLPAKTADKPEQKEEADEDEKSAKDFRCTQHFCANCGSYSRNMYQCVECPFSSHKKCMSKRNKVLSGYKMVCMKHVQKPVRQPPVEKPPKKERGEKSRLRPRTLEDGEKGAEEKGEGSRPKVPRRPSRDRSRSCLPPRQRASDPNVLPSPQATTGPSDLLKKEASKGEDATLKKRPALQSPGKLERPSKAERPTKRIKMSAEANQKIPFSLYKPFDYSGYRKKFYASELGPDTLCSHHFTMYSRKRIKLTKFKNDNKPIDPSKSTEQAYLDTVGEK